MGTGNKIIGNSSTAFGQYNKTSSDNTLVCGKFSKPI